LPSGGENQESLVVEYLNQNAGDMSVAQRQQIQDEVLGLIKHPDFAAIFGKDSRAEVPIMGEIDGKIISAQIDRLVDLPGKVLVIDFKTNRPAATSLQTTPPVYIKQLTTYAELLRHIYPQKTIEAYILWTNEARLMRIL
jgi:ATP-dependent helicase/nuclease subunit A